MIESLARLASRNFEVTGLVIALLCLVILGLIVVVNRIRWRELYAAVEFVQNNQPAEKDSPIYGHRLAWQGRYWEVVFRLGNKKGTIAFHSNGPEEIWRVGGPLWWLQIDNDNPRGFYRRAGDKTPRPIPWAMSTAFNQLVQAVRAKTVQHAQA